MSEEWVVLCDESGSPTGKALRRECHQRRDLTHAVVHVIVTDGPGERLLLQKRAPAKDIAPGQWDTSVGGHLDVGETFEAAARRETLEELGIEPAALEHAYDHVTRTRIETEFVRAFVCTHEGPFRIDGHELSEARFWSIGEIEDTLGTGVFTHSFEQEFARWREWRGQSENRS